MVEYGAWLCGHSFPPSGQTSCPNLYSFIDMRPPNFGLGFTYPAAYAPIHSISPSLLNVVLTQARTHMRRRSNPVGPVDRGPWSTVGMRLYHECLCDVHMYKLVCHCPPPPPSAERVAPQAPRALAGARSVLQDTTSPPPSPHLPPPVPSSARWSVCFDGEMQVMNLNWQGFTRSARSVSMWIKVTRIPRVAAPLALVVLCFVFRFYVHLLVFAQAACKLPHNTKSEFQI